MADPGDFLGDGPRGNAADPANADREGRGAVCGSSAKLSSPRGLHYAIYCPACGTLNYLDNRKDYYKGCCAECGSPFRLPEKLNPAMWRKVGYALFAVVLSACIWMLFFPGGGIFRAQHGQSFPVPAGRHVRAVENQPEPAAGKVKKFPLPVAAVPPQKPSSPAAPVLPKAAPVLQPEAAPGLPAASSAGAAVKAFPKRPGEAEKIAPNQTGAKSEERYDKPMERVFKERSKGPRAGTGNLLEIPLSGSADEQKK